MMLFSGIGTNGQGTWEPVSVPTTTYLKSVCFTDSLYGWIAGDSGVILHTTDGGDTWNPQETHSTRDVQDVFFLNRRLGWASTYNFTTLPYGTVLLTTTDGGSNWSPVPYPEPNIFISCILYRDSLNGWMGGEPHALLKTTNGGATWAQAAIDTSTLAFFPVLSIQFYNDQYGYASGGRFDIAGVIWRTWNGGDLWVAIDPANAPADEVHGLHLFDSLRVMGAGGDPDFGYGVGMIRTDDGGLTWVYDELEVQGNAYDLDFRNAYEAWAPLGPRQKLIYSLDTGTTWTDIPTPGLTRIYDITFPDSLHGWAVGKDGAVLKYLPPVIPGVEAQQPSDAGYRLYPNVPNPVSSLTTFSFRVPETHRKDMTPLRLMVYDLPGKQVAQANAGDVSPGLHQVVFDAALLPSGIYLCTLEAAREGRYQSVARPVRMVVGGRD